MTYFKAEGVSFAIISNQPWNYHGIPSQKSAPLRKSKLRTTVYEARIILVLGQLR